MPIFLPFFFFLGGGGGGGGGGAGGGGSHVVVRSDTCGYTSKAYDVTHASDVTTELPLIWVETGRGYITMGSFMGRGNQ